MKINLFFDISFFVEIVFVTILSPQIFLSRLLLRSQTIILKAIFIFDSSKKETVRIKLIV